MFSGARPLFTRLRVISLSSIIWESRLIYRDSHWFKVVMVKVVASRSLIFSVTRQLLMTLLLFQAFVRTTAFFLLNTFGVLFPVIWVLSFSQKMSWFLFWSTCSSSDRRKSWLSSIWMGFVTFLARTACCDWRAWSMHMIPEVVMLTLNLLRMLIIVTLVALFIPSLNKWLRRSSSCHDSWSHWSMISYGRRWSSLRSWWSSIIIIRFD